MTQMAGMNIENPSMNPNRFTPMHIRLSDRAKVNETLHDW
jgi:hypothetical protein